MTVTVVFGFIIVGVVPFFDDFLSLVGALFNPVFTNVFPGLMILFYLGEQPSLASDRVQRVETAKIISPMIWLPSASKAHRNGWKQVLALVGGIFLIISGLFIIVGGTYSAILSIQVSYNDGSVSGVFSCGDNS